jgi:hypothetical protein
VGRGVSPTIQLNLEEKVFDMGAVLVNEYVEKTFKVKNKPQNSSISVRSWSCFTHSIWLRVEMDPIAVVITILST